MDQSYDLSRTGNVQVPTAVGYNDVNYWYVQTCALSRSCQQLLTDNSFLRETNASTERRLVDI